MSASSWVHVDFTQITAATADALLVAISGGDEVWIPKSCIADPEDYRKGNKNGSISIREWFAKKIGLET